MCTSDKVIYCISCPNCPMAVYMGETECRLADRFREHRLDVPPTHTLLRMAKLVLTLNFFVFNGEHYEQIGGVTMGSKLGPNYACLIVGYVKEKMLCDYTRIKPDLYKRYMDDVAGAASCTEDDLTRFLTFASSYHPKLEYTWSIPSAKLPFLDMFLIPRDDRVATSIHYKETDSHSYLNFKLSHPFKCKASIPTSQFLPLRKICSEEDDFEEAATTTESFFVTRGYPVQLIQEGRRKAASTPRALLLAGRNANQTGTSRVPMVPTYHPKNAPVCKILSCNYNILANDDSTSVTFSQPPLKAYRWAKNLRDLLVHSDVPPDQPAQQPGTFHSKRTICRTCPHINQSTAIPSPGGQIKITGHFTCTSDNAIYCISCRKCPMAVYIGDTGCRLADCFREHRLNVLHKKSDLPVAQHFNSPGHSLGDVRVALLKSGLARKDVQQSKEMRQIFKFQTLAPRGINCDFSFLETRAHFSIHVDLFKTANACK